MINKMKWKAAMSKTFDFFVDRPILSALIMTSIDLLTYRYIINRTFENTSAAMSKGNAEMMDRTIPLKLRRPIYRLYSWYYDVNYDDLEYPFESYQTLAEFFSRTVRPRPINKQKVELLVPADSRVLSISEVREDKCMIIKDIDYSLGEFMTGVNVKMSDYEISALKRNPNNALYQIIFYLAPGDYHRFHSPADFQIVTRMAVPGSLFGVSEKSLKKHGGKVYNKNYRVLLEGRYWGGYLNMALIGAFNVGCINVNDSYAFEKGQEVGKFSFGSTVVLHFQAPPGSQFKISQGQKVRYGDVIL